jgi:lipoic acid synthetase
MREKYPSWIKKTINPQSIPFVENTRSVLKKFKVKTVCDSAHCPNLNECYGKSTATFMIMGDTCTRNCRFCSVNHGKPQKLDVLEPSRVAAAVEKLQLKHAVVTSVTRDDLEDYGVNHFVKTVIEIKTKKPDTVVEALIPDFHAEKNLVEKLVSVGPEIIGHNLETVPELHYQLKPESKYYASLTVLDMIKSCNPRIYTKSALMLGLGENEHSVIQAMRDLREVKCDIVVLGQYLQPTEKQVEVKRYVEEEEFESYREAARELGFLHITAETFARSSYHADKFSDDFIPISRKTWVR